MARVQQGEGVPVGVAGHGPPVQTGRWGAVPRCRRETADPPTAGSRGAGCGPVVQRLVGGAQATGMPHGDHSPPRDHAGEGHRASAGAEHRLPDGTREVDTPVPGRPGLRWRLEPPAHGWPGGQGPRPGTPGCIDTDGVGTSRGLGRQRPVEQGARWHGGERRGAVEGESGAGGAGTGWGHRRWGGSASMSRTGAARAGCRRKEHRRRHGRHNESERQQQQVHGTHAARRCGEPPGADPRLWKVGRRRRTCGQRRLSDPATWRSGAFSRGRGRQVG
jgi:hypothetical protein